MLQETAREFRVIWKVQGKEGWNAGVTGKKIKAKILNSNLQKKNMNSNLPWFETTWSSEQIPCISVHFFLTTLVPRGTSISHLAAAWC